MHVQIIVCSQEKAAALSRTSTWILCITYNLVKQADHVCGHKTATISMQLEPYGAEPSKELHCLCNTSSL
jgi:hypothetical protein